MDKAKGFLKTQVGPLPVWLWMVVIGAGLAVAYVIPKLTGKSSSSGTQTSTDAGTAQGNSTGMAIDPATGLPYSMSGYPAGAFAGGTNDGQQANSQDYQNLMAVLSQIANELQPGSAGTPPPANVPPVPRPTPPPVLPPAPQVPPVPARVPPTPTPTNTRTFTVRSWFASPTHAGSTLSSIAQIEYGNAALWPKIQAANIGRYPSLRTNPNLIQPGWVLTIPH